MANRRNVRTVTPLMAAIVVGGAFAGPGTGRNGDLMMDAELSLRNFLMRMSRVLRLSSNQKNRINAIIDAEMEMVRPLLDKVDENRSRLMQAAEAMTFDEEAVRDLAAGQARIDVELTVFRIKAHCQIHALLTPEQQELVRFLRSEINQRPALSPGNFASV